jgi:hypothetical protein
VVSKHSSSLKSRLMFTEPLFIVVFLTPNDELSFPSNEGSFFGF